MHLQHLEARQRTVEFKMLFVVLVFMLQTPMQPAHGARSNDNKDIGTGPDLTSEPVDVKDIGERQMAANSKCNLFCAANTDAAASFA